METNVGAFFPEMKHETLGLKDKSFSPQKYE